MAKKEKVPKTEIKEKKKRNIKSNKRRGSDYERQIAKDLREIGYEVETSRAHDRALDNAKIDLCDLRGDLPFYGQVKRCIKYPNYIEIRKSCPLKDKEFVIYWNVQKATESTFRSEGEIVVLDKNFFHKLLKTYLEHEQSNSNI